jgi:hypothetical protein
MPLGSSYATAMAQDEPPVEITAIAICCGVACQCAILHAWVINALMSVIAASAARSYGHHPIYRAADF